MNYENSDSVKEMKMVSEMLENAISAGLDSEVVLTAIKLAKDNPEMSIESICHCAINDWDI